MRQVGNPAYASASNSKPCRNCGVTKPLGDFALHKRGRDGRQSQCKVCLAAKARAHRAANPEYYAELERERDRSGRVRGPRNLATLKAWRDANRERLVEAQRCYNVRHAAILTIRVKAYCAANADKRAAAARAWHAANRERSNVNSTAWKVAHPDAVRLQKHARRARIRRAVGSLTPEQWAALKAAYDFCCLCCGRAEPTIALAIDHVVPLCNGGSNGIEHIQPLCGSCNSRKHTRTVDYRPDRATG